MNINFGMNSRRRKPIKFGRNKIDKIIPILQGFSSVSLSLLFVSADKVKALIKNSKSFQLWISDLLS